MNVFRYNMCLAAVYFVAGLVPPALWTRTVLAVHMEVYHTNPS